MANRSVTVSLKAEIGQYLSALRQAQTAAQTTAQGLAGVGTGATTAMNQATQAAQTSATTTTQVAAQATQATQQSTQALFASTNHATTTMASISGQASQATQLAANASSQALFGVGNQATATMGQLSGVVGQAVGATQQTAQASTAALFGVNNQATTTMGALAGVAQQATTAAQQTTQATQATATGLTQITTLAQENEQAWSQVSTGLMAVGAAAVAGFALAVKTFADFDKAMSSVRSATHATESDMNALSDAAIKAGADTAFSAEEAARGIEELAKAGVSTEAILGGGLDGALSLAAAGALEVGDAAEIAASALTQFKLEGSDVGHIADLLAAGAGKAQGSVHDLGMALNQSGLVAAQTGLSIEETTGGLAAFASAGLTGSDAGTSFKTMLQRLNPQSEAAATLMEDLGVSAYDSQGNFIGLTEWAGKLQTGLSGMSEQQRAAAMQTLFGSDAIRAASVVYEQGADGIQGWIDNVNESGYAAETAALMQDNLAGDLEKLGGAFDTVFLKSGSGVNDSLRSLVQGLEGVVDAAGKVPAPVLSTGAALVGIGGATALAVGGMMKMVTMAAEAKVAMTALGLSSMVTSTNLAKIGKVAGIAAGVAVLGAALLAVADSTAPVATGLSDIENALAGTPGKLDAINASFANAEWANGNQGGFAGKLQGTIEGIDGIGDAIAHLQTMSGGDKFSDWGNDVLGVSDKWSAAAEQIQNADQAIGNLVADGKLDEASANFRAFMQDVENSGGNVEEAAAGFGAYESAIKDYATSLGVTLTDQETFQAMMGEMPPALLNAAAAAEQASAGMVTAGEGSRRLEQGMGTIADSSGEAVESLEDLVDALSLLGMIELDAQAATGAFHEALRDTAEATKEMAGAIATANGEFDVTTEAGFAAQQAFAGVASAGWDMAEGVANAGGSFSDISGAMSETYDGLVATAEQFGFTSEQANALAREALGVPENVDIETFMSNSALQMAQYTGQMVGEVPGDVSISTYMSDAAFREAFRTKAEAANVPEHVAIASFMDDFARDKASKTTAAVLGIPEGSSVSSWMDANAEAQAIRTANAVNSIPKTVTITTYHQNVETWNNSSVGKAAPARSTGAPFARALGGRVPGSLPAAATGTRLPTTGPGTEKQDGFLGISSMTGAPTVWADAGEWIINGQSSEKYNALLSAVNRDDPAIRHLARHAAGARVGSREYSAAPAGFASSGPVSATLDVGPIVDAVRAGMTGANVTAVVQIGPRDAKRINALGAVNR